MSFADRVFVYIYALSLHTPSRKRADKAASFAVALVVIMHALGFLIVLSGFAHQNLLSSFGKAGIVFATLAIIAAVTYHFSANGHAKAVLQTATHDLRRARTKWLGLAILLWTLLFPFLCGALVVLMRNRHIF